MTFCLHVLHILYLYIWYLYYSHFICALYIFLTNVLIMLQDIYYFVSLTCTCGLVFCCTHSIRFVIDFLFAIKLFYFSVKLVSFRYWLSLCSVLPFFLKKNNLASLEAINYFPHCFYLFKSEQKSYCQGLSLNSFFVSDAKCCPSFIYLKQIIWLKLFLIFNQHYTNK